MPKFAANLSMMYNESEFLDRFKDAANSGFKGVEYLFPYSYEKNKLVDLLGSYSLTQVLHNLPAGDWESGERGIACDPERTGEFQDGVGKAIEYASALKCIRVNCLAGIPPDGVPVNLVQQTFINNLEFAAKKLDEAGIKLLIEPINTRDIPGFYLTNTKQAISIIRAVNSDNIYLQYDIYHMQIMEGDLTPAILNNLDIIDHFQIADTPGRNEPGTGEINYPFLFEMIDNTGYKGWIGCEYKPSESTNTSLDWAKSYLV